MANHLNTDEAIHKAEAEFLRWLATVQDRVDAAAAGGDWTVPVKNDGTDDYVWKDKVDAIIDKWKAKPALRGFNRRAGNTSHNDPKLDLKFAYPNQANSSFNYHIKWQVDPAVIEAERKREEESARTKKLAAEHAAQLQREKEAREAAAKKAAEQKKHDDARLKQMTDGANAAWNKFKDTKAWNKNIVEKTWKTQWIHDNQGRYK